MSEFPLGQSILIDVVGGVCHEWHTYRVRGVELKVHIAIAEKDARTLRKRELRKKLREACVLLWGEEMVPANVVALID